MQGIEAKMSYSSKAVANKFIDIALKKGESLTPMKLQKLVYYAHGWYLSLTNGKPLIDEQIEAWRYGPVVPSLYHEFKSYGSKGITHHAKDFCYEEDYEDVVPRLPENKTLNKFIEKVWKLYGKYSGVVLSNKTHIEGTPWAAIWGEEGVSKNTDIPNELIKDYFDKLKEKSQVNGNK